MKITKQEVDHIAQLARIELSDKDVNRFTEELSKVLEWIEQLKELDTTGIEPLAHVGGVKNRYRVDRAEDFGSEGIEKIKDNFPERSGDFVKVRKVL